jgi:prepilin-type N-terminal cleavage/methylation domain-containing protein
MSSQKGFTLMEIIISVGILAIVATLLSQVLFTTAHVNNKTEILTDIKQDGNFALDVIGRMVRSAKSIDACNAGTLQITNPDNNKTTFKCATGGNAARIASDSGSPNPPYLTGGNVTLSSAGDNNCILSSLAFSCAPAVGNKNQVTVTFTLGPVGGSGSVYESGSAAFSSTIRMRN